MRAELTLAHWMAVGANHTLRLDSALLEDPPARLAGPLDMVDMPPDQMVAYDAVIATEDPWVLRLWSYDRDKREYGARWTRLRLRLNRRTVSAQLGTFAGVPVMWNHYTWGSGSSGRVSTMTAANAQLRGVIALSSRALAQWGTSLDQIDAGMNTGLSIGAHLYDTPKHKRAEGDDGGTFDKPDELIYGRIRVTEVSLTAMPMIAQAGIVGRKGDAND